MVNSTKIKKAKEISVLATDTQQNDTFFIAVPKNTD